MIKSQMGRTENIKHHFILKFNNNHLSSRQNIGGTTMWFAFGLLFCFRNLKKISREVLTIGTPGSLTLKINLQTTFLSLKFSFVGFVMSLSTDNIIQVLRNLENRRVIKYKRKPIISTSCPYRHFVRNYKGLTISYTKLYIKNRDITETVYYKKKNKNSLYNHTW